MNIKILYDNNTSRINILSGWGFSCLVGEDVLFDTGERFDSLMHNINEMGVMLPRITDIVISHDHWDHTGGLEGLLKSGKGINVYGCPGFSREFSDKVKGFGGNLIEKDGKTRVSDNISVTGPLSGIYKEHEIVEQALLINTPNGLTVITGCAHPGITNIVKRVKEHYEQENIYCLLGGFHLKDKSEEKIIRVAQKLRELGVKRAGPAHCTGDKGISIFADEFKDNFISIAAGKTLEV